MGRGKGFTYSANDIANMSPDERHKFLGAVGQMPKVRVSGAAVVRDKDGNAKYADPKMAGKYNEDSLS